MVLLVLLLAVLPPAPGCVFPHSPVTSTFTAAISELREHLLLDYSVLMPANLEPDARCTELWMVHFLAAELGRMGGVAGAALQPLLAEVARETHFIKNCAISDPESCVGLEQANVSRMLSTLNGHMEELKSKFQLEQDFSNCSRIRCQPGPALPQPSLSSQKQTGTQASGASSLHRSHLLALLGPLVGYLAFVSLWHWQRRLRSQGTQEAEQADT